MFIPNNIAEHIKTKNTSLVPVVIISDKTSYENQLIDIEDDENAIFHIPRLLAISTNELQLTWKKGVVDTYHSAQAESGVTLPDIVYKITTLPLLLNIPSLKESLDIDKRNHKISNMNIDISNLPYISHLYDPIHLGTISEPDKREKRRFSDIMESGKLFSNKTLNLECRIYWVAPNSTNLEIYDSHKGDTDSYVNHNNSNDALQIFFGIIRKYDMNDEKCRLVIEDYSQKVLQPEVPTRKFELPLTSPDLFTFIPEEIRGKPIPMVYARGIYDEGGFKSPAYKVGPTLDDVNADEIPIARMLICDSQSIILKSETIHTYGENVPIKEGPLYIYEGGYLSINEFHNQDQTGAWTAVRNHTGSDNNGYVNLYQTAEFSEGFLHSWQPTEITQTRLYMNTSLTGAHGILQVVSDAPDGVYGWHPDAGPEVNYPDLTKLTDFTGATSLTVYGHQKFGAGIYDAYDTPFVMFLFTIKLNTAFANETVEVTLPATDTTDEITESVPAVETFLIMSCVRNSFTTGDGVEIPYYDLPWYHGSDIYPFHNLKTLDGPDYATETHSAQNWNNGEGSTIAERQYPMLQRSGMGGGTYSSQEGWTDSKKVNSEYYCVKVPANYVDSETDTAYDHTHYISLTLSEFHAWQDIKINKPLKRDYYIAIQSGRTFGNDEGHRSPRIISHILDTELGVNEVNGWEVQDPTLDLDYVLSHPEYYYLGYDFTIIDSIPTKKLLQEISSASPYISHFDNMGIFKFTLIQQSYNHEEISSYKRIHRSDCISYNYSRTKPESIYTKVVLRYKWDYATKNYTEVAIVEHTDLSLYPSYDLDFYDLSDDKPTLTTKKRGFYIRSAYTAETMAKWLLYWHLNQHLIIKIRLGLSWLGVEIGELLTFDEVLGDSDPYGINYKWDAIWSDNDAYDTNYANYIGDVVNGQQVFPVFMCIKTNKTLNYIDLELIQMHNMADTPLARGTVLGCVIEDAWNYNEEATADGVDNNGSCIYAEDFTTDLCALEVNPTGELAGDSNADFSTNYAGDDNIYDPNGNQLPNVFIINNEADDDPDDPSSAISLAKNYYQSGGTPIIYNYSRCLWADTTYHKITHVGVSVENPDGTFNDLGLIDLEMAIPEVFMSIDQTFYNFYIGNGGINVKLIYYFTQNDPTFRYASLFSDWHRGFAPAFDFITTMGIHTADNVYSTSGYETERFLDNSVNGVFIGDDHNVLYGTWHSHELKITVGEHYKEIPANSFQIRYYWDDFALPPAGDMNNDGVWNILDIVGLANCVLAQTCADTPLYEAAGDLNGDGAYNVLDIVSLANCVLAGNCGDIG